MVSNNIPVRILLERGPLLAETHPRRVAKHARQRSRHLDRVDGRMRVRQVQQHRHGQVAAGRVAADDHVRGCPAAVGEDVAEGADGLAQLGWVDFVRGEGVPREEDGDVVAVFVDDLQEVEPEVEVGGYGSDGEAASCGCTGLD